MFGMVSTAAFSEAVNIAMSAQEISNDEPTMAEMIHDVAFNNLRPSHVDSSPLTLARALATKTTKLSMLFVAIIAHTQFTQVTALDETCLQDNIGVNVLVSNPDLEITTVENADLPDLPAGTRSISYGPSATSCTSFDGVVVIGGAGSLDPTNSFHHYTVGQINAMKLFLDWMNTERGGLRVGNKTYGLRYVWVGDHQKKWHITEAIAHAIRGTHADFTFAGYSSGLSAFAAKQSFAAGKIMMTWGAATPSVHSQNNLTFGFLPPAPIFSSSALAAIATAAEAIDAGLSTSVDQNRCAPGSCKTSIRVGFIQADALYTKTNCVAAPGWADTYNLATARDADGDPLTITVPKAPSIDQTILALTELQASGVNVIVGCTYSSTGFKIIEALEQMDYSPLSLVITATVDGSTYLGNIENDWWQGEYVLGPAPWTRNAPLVGEFSGLDSPQFAEKYKDRFGDYPVYQSASSYAAISTLCAAIEAAETLDTEQVAATMRGMRDDNSMTEFYTEVNLNDDGQVEPNMFVTQFAPRNATLNIVAPPGSEYGEGLHFPTPTWATRRCRAIGPGHAAGSSAEMLSLECSGHGFCNEEGACVCEPTHSGVLCDMLIQTLPDSMISRTEAFASVSTCIREATAANVAQTSCTDDFGDSASGGGCSYDCTTLSAGLDNTVCYISREDQWYASDNTCDDASCENEEDISAVFTAAEGSRRTIIQGANAETQCCHDPHQYHDPLVPLDEPFNTCGLSAELLADESLPAGCDAFVTQPDECMSPSVCGFPCANVHLMQTGEALTLSQAELMLRHLQFTGHIPDNISTAALNFTRSSVMIQYSSVHNNVAAVHAADSNLSVSFSKITGNIASGCCTSPGIVATTQTNIAVDHCDFAENEVTACDLNAIVCDDGADVYAATGLLVTKESIATVEHSRFDNSRGAPTITSSDSSELDIQYSTISNNQVDEDGMYAGRCAGITVISGSSVTMSFVSLFSNTGVVSGALLVSGSGSTAHTFHSLLHSNRGTTSTLGSGAIAVTSNGSVSITETTIDNNMGTAPLGAGAILGTDASIIVSASLLQNNRVQGNPHSDRGSGAIYSERSETVVADSQLVSNYGVREGGLLSGFSDAIHAYSPADVKLVDTQYAPFSEEDSVQIHPGSHHGRLRGGCQDHPCPLGYECSYSKFSLSCSQCSSQSHSPDGLRCVSCPAGTGPSVDRTTCVPCGGNNYSNFGVCQPCGSQLIASDDHQSCRECPVFQVASEQGDSCVCAPGYYDSTQFLPACHLGEYDASQTLTANSALTCQSCANMACLQDCNDTTLDVKPGWTILEEDQEDKIVNIYRCNFENSCPGGSHRYHASTSCTVGYTSTLCAVCEEHYVLDGGGECTPCGKLNKVGFAAAVFILLVGLVVLKNIRVWFAAFGNFTTVFGFLDGLQLRRFGKCFTILFGFLEDLQLKPVGKCLIATLQILGGLATNLKVHFPITFQTFLDTFVAYFRFDLVGILIHMEFGCITDGRYGSSLAITFCMIFVVVASVGVYYMYCRWVDNRSDVTEEERRENAAKLFAKFDFDGKGINRDEVAQIAAKISPDVTDAEIDKLFNKADTDGGGRIDFEEFYTAAFAEQPVDSGPDEDKNSIQEENYLDLGALVNRKREADKIAEVLAILFASVFLLYPGVTNKIFDGLNCRDLGSMNVLDVDYSIDCDATYWQRTFFNGSLVILWPIGLPVTLLIVLYRRRELIRQEDEETLQELDFVIGDYKTEYWYWEIVELARKLILTGLIGLFKRGSIVQSFVATILSFFFFAYSVKAQPYKIASFNMIKIFTEFQIFGILIVCVVLQTNRYGLPVVGTGTADDYGMFQLVLTLGVIPLVIFVLYFNRKLLARLRGEQSAGAEYENPTFTSGANVFDVDDMPEVTPEERDTTEADVRR